MYVVKEIGFPARQTFFMHESFVNLQPSKILDCVSFEQETMNVQFYVWVFKLVLHSCCSFDC